MEQALDVATEAMHLRVTAGSQEGLHIGGHMRVQKLAILLPVGILVEPAERIHALNRFRLQFLRLLLALGEQAE